MAKPRIFPGLDSLVDLADVGVDIRPTLLRVLTDLYVQQGAHSLEEERQYCELAHRLVDGVDAATRTAVAAKLAAYPGAPQEILVRLDAGTREVQDGLATASAARPAPAPSAPGEAAAAEARELSAIFAAAAAEERSLIILTLDVAFPQERDDLRAAPSAIAALELMALQRRTDEFIKGLGRLLAVSDGHARWIVEDLGGEPIVVAGKALDMPNEVMQRVLLFLNPAIGHSVKRVYDLVQLSEDSTVAAAHALVSLWQAAHPRLKRPLGPAPTQRAPRGEPVHPAPRPAASRALWPTRLRDRGR